MEKTSIHHSWCIPSALTALVCSVIFLNKLFGFLPANKNSNAKAAGKHRANFEFAFNDAEFSDRVLHLEITDNSSEGGPKRKQEDSESCAVVKVKTFHINSLLLAINSPFFHKLFKNGMRESNQRDATLRISASEEAGVMEVLNFMYSNTLKSTTTLDLLGVLIAADKFEATECVRCCSEQLQKMPVSLESAAQYLELPSSVLMYEEVQPLIGAAKKCLLAQFKDINYKSQEATMMTLPLYVVEDLLSSTHSMQQDLSGDNVFEFILKWARAQYPQHNERHEILTKNLSQFIPFRQMSTLKLKEALVCPDLDYEKVSKLILEALISMVEDSHGQNIHSSNKYPIVKVEVYGAPQPRCFVYFDLRKEDCENVMPSSALNSRSFRLGGRSFYLSAQYSGWEQRQSFGLYLYMTKESQSCSVQFEFEAMSKSSMKFRYRGSKVINYSDSLLGCGFSDPFFMSWTRFMSEDCDYFIDEILHLRADITFKDSKA